MTSRTLKSDSPWLLALLAALVALGPLSVDMYLPALPAMMRAFDTSVSAMHLTLSVYLTGFALFHLLCGPLADRFGRKPILILGTAIFVAACISCSQAETIRELLWSRFFQGMGACVGPTLARAIVRDVFGPTRAARALSLIAMLMALAPAIAPSLGGALLLLFPWPSIFWFLAAYGIAVITIVARYLEESLPTPQSLHPLAIAQNYAELLKNPMYVSITCASALIYAGLMAYLSASSFVYIEMLGVPVEYFGAIFLTSVGGYIGGSAVSARMSSRIPSERILLVGIIMAVIASGTMLAGSSVLPNSIIVLVLPMIFYSMGMGLVLPHSMAIALRPFPHIAGTASAWMGFTQMAISALSSAMVGHFLQDSPAPMVLAMFALSCVALVLGFWFNWTYDNRNP